MRIPVLYSQVAVFNNGIENPFNDWDEQHVRQGFAWRMGSVSFAMPNSVFEIDIDVRRLRRAALSNITQRAIVVPFRIAGGCGVEVGGIAETFEVDIPDGDYCLLFELSYKNEYGLASVTFTFLDQCEAPRILKNDGTLSATGVFLMQASPA